MDHTLCVVRPRRLLRAALLALVPFGMAAAAGASEISAFVSGASPTDVWGRGYGGLLTITLFDVVHGEVEGAYQHGDVVDTSLLTASGKAYLGPTFGRLIPYAGLGVGVYHEGLPADSDNGRFGSLFLGAKLKFPVGLVVRAEYQWISMPVQAPAQLDHRYFLAAGLRF